MSEDSTLSLSHEERLRVLAQQVEQLAVLNGELFRAKYQLRAEMDAYRELSSSLVIDT